MLYHCDGPVSYNLVNTIRMNQRRANDIIAVTGAGISVESGLPVGENSVLGLPLPEFFRTAVWMRDPAFAYRVLRSMLRDWRGASPNLAHRVLAKANVRIITQNIDGLHRDAGTKHLIELHGNLRELSCRTCGAVFPSSYTFDVQIDVPICPTCNSILLPGVVLEGEEVRHVARAMEWVLDSRLLLVIGTELNMDPVRRLREACQQNAGDVVWITSDAESWVNALFSEYRS